jgi:alpha-tubulin suppressor-like RCC1 family protein
MMLNIEQLKQDLDTYISSVDSNTSTDDIMVLTAALDNLTNDRIISLNFIDDLPEAYNVSPGTIVFVKEINTLVYSVVGAWKGTDGRLLRTDPVILYSWGLNSFGELGINLSTVSRSSPVTVVGGITNWSKVGESSMALSADGVLWGWGSMSSGNKGVNPIPQFVSSPVTVLGGIRDWTQIASLHGITSRGIAYAWGCNINGQLGDGTDIARSSPVTVVGGITNWSQITTGFGVTANGDAYAWGCNAVGRLGIGSVNGVSVPTKIVGDITDWKQVSGGSFHAIGLTKSGVIYAWGNNNAGQLGSGNTIARSSPATIVGGITNWSFINAGGQVSAGIADGIAYAWGCNTSGQLGDGTKFAKSSPVTFVGSITNWKKISISNFVLGLTESGVLYAWGQQSISSTGALGDGTVINRSSPVLVKGGFTDWIDCAAAGNTSFAIRTG